MYWITLISPPLVAESATLLNLLHQPACHQQRQQSLVPLRFHKLFHRRQYQAATQGQFGLGVGQPGFFSICSTSLPAVVAKRRLVFWPWKSKVCWNS